MKIRRALISVHDKSGVVDLAKELTGYGVEILSTGGTAKLLRDSGLAVRDVSEVTGFPEMMNGRVKTLHPKIHGGILARRDVPEHLEALEKHGIPPIDLVVVALYPFEETIARPGVTLAEAIEQIDVGGPTMIRAAAKNHSSVAVLTAPSQYAALLDELKATGGRVGDAMRARLAQEAFRRTAQYDAAIAAYMRTPQGAQPPREPEEFPHPLRLEAERALPLKYGENPHQTAAFYRLAGAPPFGLAAMQQLHGPELGYNNVLDFSAALGLLLEFDDPAAVVIKHTNPCGVATGDRIDTAYVSAREADPLSAFGGIVGLNRTIDVAAAQALTATFIEAVIAPSIDDAARAVLATRQNLRVVTTDFTRAYEPIMGRDPQEARSFLGGTLIQQPDRVEEAASAWPEGDMPKVVTKRSPTAEEWVALRFAWRVCAHVKSNAVIFTGAGRTLAIGAGQMSRVDAVKVAVMKSGTSLAGSVAASDAFFPFRDGLDAVAAAGASAVVQPGGSVRDAEVIAAADEHGLAMVCTGRRHFRH
jgi:phosphoribosylaminoimidazolecarboxamide formyltransferase / IMP cyclohydrolase